jgi:Arc/MetJ-type ribon-helix-helix transcriptional regulator
MSVELKNPQLEEFIDEQVMKGHYPSREAAVQAAVEQMKIDQEELALTDADIDAINESDAQIDRGECIDFDTFAVDMRRKYSAD